MRIIRKNPGRRFVASDIGVESEVWTAEAKKGEQIKNENKSNHVRQSHEQRNYGCT